jgi:hypothetical protein
MTGAKVRLSNRMKTKQKKPVEIDFDPEFQHALSLMEDEYTPRNLLFTGRAAMGSPRAGLLYK